MAWEKRTTIIDLGTVDAARFGTVAESDTVETWSDDPDREVTYNGITTSKAEFIASFHASLTLRNDEPFNG